MNVMQISSQSNRTKTSKSNNNPAFCAVVKIKQKDLKFVSTETSNAVAESLPKLKQLFDESVEILLDFKDNLWHNIIQPYYGIKISAKKIGENGKVLQKSQFRLDEFACDPAKELSSDNITLFSENIFASKSRKETIEKRHKKKAYSASDADIEAEKKERLNALQKLQCIINQVTKG